MQSEVRNLTADLDSLREQFEEEQESKAEVQRQLSKAHNEVQMWRSKCESGGGASAEAVEELRYADSTKPKTPYNINQRYKIEQQVKWFISYFYHRRRMQAKLNEAEQNLEAANAKISQLEKVKLRMGQEMEDLVIEVERVRFTFKIKIFNWSLKRLFCKTFNHLFDLRSG